MFLPVMLADMFMKMAPMAGCSFGIPGNSREKNGLISRPKNSITPPFSPIFIIPIHSVSTPVRPNEISKAKAAWEKEEFIISVHMPVLPQKSDSPTAIRKAMRKNVIHIQLSTIGQTVR